MIKNKIDNSKVKEIIQINEEEENLDESDSIEKIEKYNDEESKIKTNNIVICLCYYIIRKY